MDPRLSRVQHKVAEIFCFKCNHKLNGASGIGTDEAPRANDLTICIECGTLYVFDSDLSVALAPPLLELPADVRSTVIDARFQLLAANQQEKTDGCSKSFSNRE